MMDIESGGPSSYQNGSNQPNPNYTNSLPGDTKIKALQNDVHEITEVMKTNINKVIERGDRVDMLNERSELLNSRAAEFRINSRNIRRKFWWENFRLQIIIGIIALVVVALILYFSLKS